MGKISPPVGRKLALAEQRFKLFKHQIHGLCVDVSHGGNRSRDLLGFFGTHMLQDLDSGVFTQCDEKNGHLFNSGELVNGFVQGSPPMNFTSDKIRRGA